MPVMAEKEEVVGIVAWRSVIGGVAGRELEFDVEVVGVKRMSLSFVSFASTTRFLVLSLAFGGSFAILGSMTKIRS